MIIEDDVKLDYSDVLIRPKRSTLKSRKDVSLERSFKFRNSNSVWQGIPIIVANMAHTGTINVSNVLNNFNMLTALHKFHSLDDISNNINDFSNIAISTGITNNDLEKLEVIMNAVGDQINFICIDVANGYTEMFSEFVKTIRKKYPTKIIMAGNVVTADMTQELILSGADIIKIGIGPGSTCTTRKQTGVGYPQFSAVIECADAAHGLGGHVCADGGCISPGDVAKAFGAGADFVMLGSMFAGHKECSGDIIAEDGTVVSHEYATAYTNKMFYKRFYGMSSKEAQEKHGEGLKEYRASEGKSVKVPYKGKINTTVKEILGGIRSTCTYVGALTLKDLPKCTTFVRVNRQLNTLYGND